MKILCVDHIGIAVKSIDESAKFYTELLGLKMAGVEVVEAQKVKTAFIPTGEAEIELLESTAPDGPVAKFIEKKGEGIKHIARRGKNIKAALKKQKKQGVRLKDEKPRLGAGGPQI